jgi:Rps23 Pro-64 3,4-dihydroxylase Tpa1-like proline 4-hydroxylase
MDQCWQEWIAYLLQRRSSEMVQVMALTFDHPSFGVIDDFLDEEVWTSVWTDFQFMDLHPVTRTLGAWKLEDGVPLGGDEIIASSEGSLQGSSPLASVVDAVRSKFDSYSGLIGDDWDRISARPYVYPQGTGLSWHVDDHQLYAGAFIYYAHPHWNAHWGGELLIAERDVAPDADPEEMPIMGHRFETESYSERLLEMGCGNFIAPKPNRLVLLKGAPHMVSRISPAAGASVRATVAGFFLRPDNQNRGGNNV